MVQMPSIKALKSFLITSQLVELDDWNQVIQDVGEDNVTEILDVFEQRHALTALQRSRILNDDANSLLLGRYKIMYRNGSGSFARVFRASTLNNEKIVALKLLRERWATSPAAVANFQREAHICQRFQHPNIVPIYEVVSDGPNHFIAMEFVEGGNLRDFLRMRQSVTPVEAIGCAHNICSGLSYAHSKETTHRDVKLNNVLMGTDRTAKLVDFGLAGEFNVTQSRNEEVVPCALEYAALEKGTNAPRNDPRSDIFFAGAILYELLSSESPWPRTRNREERKQLSRYTQYRPLHFFRPDLPQSILDITARMMEVSPNNRYQTADEAKSDLREVLQELGAWTADKEAAETNGHPVAAEDGDFHLLIVDNNKSRVKVLRPYFERHGFRLSFVDDPETALEQLKGCTPPSGLLFLADSACDSVLSIFPQTQAWGRTLKTPCLGVFSADDKEYVRQAITSTRFGTTMFQPATLRDIRRHFEEMVSLNKS